MVASLDAEFAFSKVTARGHACLLFRWMSRFRVTWTSVTSFAQYKCARQDEIRSHILMGFLRKVQCRERYERRDGQVRAYRGQTVAVGQ